MTSLSSVNFRLPRSRLAGFFRICLLLVSLVATLLPPRALAAVWVPESTQTYTTYGWTLAWVEGHWSWEWVDGYTENQTVEGYWREITVQGHNEAVWVDGYWETQWSDGYWEDQWVDGYTDSQWTDGYWNDVWSEGYTDEEGNWNEGYWSQEWVDGSWSTVTVDGYWSSVWVDGSATPVWVDGYPDTVWIDGYTDWEWVDETTETVTVPGHYMWIWYDGYWDLVAVPTTVTTTIAGHWEGEWTWSSFSEPAGEVTWSAWSPDPSEVPAGQLFYPSRSGSRQVRTGERNEAGDERNVQTSSQPTSETSATPSTGTNTGGGGTTSGGTTGGGTTGGGTTGGGSTGGSSGGSGVAGTTAPWNFRAIERGQRHAILAWEAPTAGAPVDFYQVRDAAATTRAEAVDSPEKTLVWGGLPPSTTKTFEVRAVDTAGVPSAWVSHSVSTESAASGPGSTRWEPVWEPKWVNGSIQWTKDSIPDEIIAVDQDRFTARVVSAVAGYAFNEFWTWIQTLWGGASWDADWTQGLILDPFYDDNFSGSLSLDLEFTFVPKLNQPGQAEWYSVFVDDKFGVATNPNNWGMVSPSTRYSTTALETIGYSALADSLHYSKFFLVRHGKGFDRAEFTLGGVGVTLGTTAGGALASGLVTINGTTVNLFNSLSTTIPLPGGGFAVVSGSGIGGSITLPDGTIISIGSDGLPKVTLPPTAPAALQTIVKAIDLAGRVLAVAKGAVISVRDILGNLPVPLPPPGSLGGVDIGISKNGRFQVGILMGDNATLWIDIITAPVKVVSRDRFLAGSVRLPEGRDDFELELINTTTGESMGRHGGLLGNGATKIYGAVDQILSDADVQSGGQSESQKVWFVKDATDSRLVSFYTLFEGYGNVEARLWLGDTKVTEEKHTLVASDDFGVWIAYVERWVNGDDFQFPGLPTTPAVAAYAMVSSTTGAGSAGNRNLIRAALIPIFNVIAKVEGLEALAIGVFDGAKTGLKDDWDTAVALYGLAGTAGSKIESELQDWRRNPLRRATELMALSTRICADLVFAPFASAASHLSSWDNFKNHAWATWDKIKGGAPKAWAATRSLAGTIASGFTSWMDDFSRRMMVGAERTAFQNAPWRSDELAADLIGVTRTMAYSAGYYSGYLGEQVAMGLVTAGVGKIASVLVKGAAPIASSLLKGVGNAVTTRLVLLKKSLDAATMSEALRAALDRGLTKAARTRVSSTNPVPITEYIEIGMVRTGFNRADFNVTRLVERVAVPGSKLEKFARILGQEETVFKRIAEAFEVLGSDATSGALKGWMEVQERLLRFDGSVLIKDLAADMPSFWRAHVTPDKRALLRDGLQDVSTRAAQFPDSPWIIGRYDRMQTITAGQGHLIEAHHIVEKRHLQNWGESITDAPSVILSKEDHYLITRLLEDELLPSGNNIVYSRERVWAAYQQAYAQYPEWLSAIRGYFTP